MSLFKICKGAETNLPQTLTNGYCYFCTDTTNFYIDYTDTYGALTRSKISAKYADKLRYTEDGNFVEIEPTDVLTKNNYETAIGVAATDKNGLMSSGDKTKLDGIADGAGTDDVKYVVQDLTSAQKMIARQNIETERIKRVYYWDNVDGNDIRTIVNGSNGFGIIADGGHSVDPQNVTINGGTMSFPAFVICGSISYGIQDFSVIDNDGKFWSGSMMLSSGTGEVRLISKDETMVVNITQTYDSDGNIIYTADKTSQEIASAVVNDKKNVVAVWCTGIVYNTLQCSYANLTDTTSQSVFIVLDHDSKTSVIMTISNDGTNDSIKVNTDPFTMIIGIEQTTNEQGDAVYISDYTADEIGNAILSNTVPVCRFDNSNGFVYGTLSNYNASNGCFQFTTTDGSDCGVYYMNIYADYHVEVGKTSIPTYTEATSTESGLMSALDKIKLDGIAENADDNVQSDWSQDTDTDDSYIKNRPFKTLSGDDFSVVDNTLSLSTAKLDSIKTLGITGAQADQFIKVSSVDSNGNPTAYSAESLDDKYISSKGGTYDLTNNITFTKSNDTVSAADITENRVINFIGQPVNISGTNYIYKSGITHAGFSTNRIKEDGTAPVASYLLPNIWQMLDDQIDGDHRKLYVRPYEIEFRRYNSGWKMFYIRAEKDRALIYNDQKLIDFNESRLTNLGTPTNDTDAATKKYVDDLVPVEATTSVSGLMSATDKVKLDGVASNAASVTIKTWTTADMA